jgi:hypothetical protein
MSLLAPWVRATEHLAPRASQGPAFSCCPSTSLCNSVSESTAHCNHTAVYGVPIDHDVESHRMSGYESSLLAITQRVRRAGAFGRSGRVINCFVATVSGNAALSR